MSVLYTQNWDSASIGSISGVTGWTNISGVISVAASAPLSGSNAVTPTTLASGSARAAYTALGTTTNPSVRLAFRASATGFSSLYVDMQADDSAWYRVNASSSSGTLTIERKSGGTVSTLTTGNIGSGNGGSFTPTAGTYYYLEIERTSGNVVRARVYPTATTPSGWDASATDGSPLAAGYPGIGGNAATTVVADDFQYSGDPPSLASGVPTLTAAGDSSATVATTVATGGTAPYAYQWQRSISPSIGFADVSGATSTTLSDTGLTNGTTYFYRVIVTDSASPTPASSTSTVVAALALASLKILCVGDSWLINTPSGGTAAGDLLAGALDVTFGGTRKITISNQGAGGTNTNDWRPAGSLLPAAKTAAPSGTYPLAFIHLGINDSSTNFGNYDAATYQSQLLSVAQNLVSGGYTVLIAPPPFIGDISSNHTAVGIARLAAYQASCAAVAATDPTHIFSLQGAEYSYYVDHQSDLGADQVHPSAAGTPKTAALWARMIFQALTLPVASNVRSGVDRGDGVLGSYSGSGGGGSAGGRLGF